MKSWGWRRKICFSRDSYESKIFKKIFFLTFWQEKESKKFEEVFFLKKLDVTFIQLLIWLARKGSKKYKISKNLRMLLIFTYLFRICQPDLLYTRIAKLSPM